MGIKLTDYKKFLLAIVLASLFLLIFSPITSGMTHGLGGYIKYSDSSLVPSDVTVTITNLNNSMSLTILTVNGWYGAAIGDDLLAVDGNIIKVNVSYGGCHGNNTIVVDTSVGPSQECNVTIYGNLPPDIPSQPSGSSSGYKEVSYNYSTLAVDNESDDVYCWFDWGDSTNSGWLGPYSSGVACNSSHLWDEIGDYIIKVKTKDIKGAERVEWSQPFTVTIIRDTISPEITSVLDVPDPQNIDGWVNISCTVTDNIEVSTVKVDITCSSFSVNTTMINIMGTNDYYYNATYSTDGTYNYFIWANDNSENGKTSAVYNFRINGPPTADFTYTPPFPTIEDIIQFNDSSTDSDGTIASWHWEFGDDSTSNGQNLQHKYASDGTYQVNLTVTDNDGATNTISKQVNVNNIPPIADFTYLPSNPIASTVIEFTDNSADTDGNIASWYWDFGDSSSSTKQNPTHIYSNHGTYQVSLTVTDNDGATNTTTSTITVTRRSSYSGGPSNIAPTANFTYSPSNPTTSTIIEFIDNSTDPDGDIVSWLWDFRDGTTTTGESPTYIYSNKGTYDVTLIVTDNEGATDTKTVNVTVSVAVSGLIDLYIDSSDISFSNETPLINETVTVYAAIHNLGESNVTAIINFYDGDPSFNTSKFIGFFSVSVPPTGTNTATVEWIATTVGAHNIYVVISNCQPSETNEENNVAFNTLIVAEKATTETPANLVVYVFIAVIISTTILFYFKKRTTKK